MSWWETLTSPPALFAGLVGLTAAVYSFSSSSSGGPQRLPHSAHQAAEQLKDLSKATQADSAKGRMAQAGASIMSPPAAQLAPPKDDPISPSALAQFDGSDPSKPVYVAIKGRVFDVSAKREMYGQGQGYNVFAGRDASKGLGMSSLDPKDAVPDYSALSEAQMKTLDQWESFFEKRYNIVGRVSK